jgi:uncharacterized protein (UPF0333 family)
MENEKTGPNWSLIIGVLVVAAGIAYLIYSMATSDVSVDMGSGSH